ncbi:hypothetical protein [Streptomyces sp. IMTB 2501]|uniref:hypothetical protein n=1 Tax=Streptomyces sp. IMTB 2501 TaxID=1776340 RepID=UPI001180F38A|nr:hypothetical protein [Streptomyces sp. IMTB 2501]
MATTTPAEGIWDRITRYTLVAVYAAIMFLLGFLAVDTRVNGPDLSGGVTPLGGVLLGLVLNPKHVPLVPFIALAVGPIGIGSVAAWKLFTVHPHHPSAGLVVATCVAIFAGLFVDTSKITQP